MENNFAGNARWNVNKTKVFSENSNQTPEKVQDGEILGEILIVFWLCKPRQRMIEILTWRPSFAL